MRLKLDDLFEARERGARADGRSGRELYRLRTGRRSHPNLFRAVQIEKRMMFIILTLIVAVAAFNLVSTLVMLVTDKQADIAILRTLGAAPRSIMQIFMVQGVADRRDRHAARAWSAGSCSRSTSRPWCRSIESAFGFKFLPKDVYLHPRPALGRAAGRRHRHRAHLAGAVVPRHALPELARVAVNPAEALRYE